MKRWRWIVGVVILGLCSLSVIFINCPNCFYHDYVQSSNAQDVLAQKQIKPKPLSKIWIDNMEPERLCFSIKQEITSRYAESVEFYIDSNKAFYRWAESLPYEAFVFCTAIQNIELGQHVAKVEFGSASGKAYLYSWVFEVKTDGIVPEVTATTSQ